MKLGLSGVHFTYDTGCHALDDVTLDINSGERCALVGSNGAGKSTLLLMLAGIIDPAAGARTVDGAAATAKSLAGRVGLVLQNPDDQLFGATVREDLTFGPLNLGMNRNEAGARADEVLEQTGLQAHADTPVHALSFGLKKRVAVAGVLAMRPEVVLLDEPFAGLDVEAKSSVERLASDIADSGSTVIIATHDLDRALVWAERAVLLQGGRIAAAGSTTDVLLDEASVVNAGLNIPASVRISRAVNGALDPVAVARLMAGG